MNYEKLTIERFALHLKEGKYVGITGARRAIGKTDWSDAVKKKAHALADKHLASGGVWADPRQGKAVKKVALEPAKKTAAPLAVRPERAPTKARTLAEPVSIEDPQALPKVTSLSELLETATAMREMFESMQKAAAVDPSPEMKSQLAEAFKSMTHVFDVLRLTTVRTSSVRSGEVIRETHITERRVAGSNVQPTSHIHTGGKDDQQHEESQALLDRTFGRAVGGR